MEEQERDALKIKLVFVSLVVFLIFAILVMQLWKIQIVQGSVYAADSKGNILRTIVMPAPRGDIVDSRGKVLATSEPRFAVTLDWLDLQQAQGYNLKDVVSKLAHYVKPFWSDSTESESQITEDILAKVQMQQFARYENVVVMQNISPQLQAILAEHQDELPCINVEALPYRTYPLQTMAGHELGYVREVSASQLPQFQAKAKAAGLSSDTYQQGDLVGQMGVENSYDLYLRGKNGSQVVEVDNTARPVQLVQDNKPVVGDTVQLNIDSDLQGVISNAMDSVISGLQKNGHPLAGAGAAVVIDVKTGKIIAMVSKPSMNPNALVGDISQATFNQYFGDSSSSSPRLGWSRAFQSTYAPGSTFKMIVGMAALQAGVITPNSLFGDTVASLSHPNAGVGNDYSGSRGKVDLGEGLALSINVYFEHLGELVMNSNPERLAQVAHEFGLGKLTGVDIPGESSGVAPSPAWKEQLNGPLLKQILQNALALLQKQYKADLAKATTDTQRKQIEAQYNLNKQNAIYTYNQNFKWEAGWQWFDTYNTSIGQGDNKYTILQLADYVATIANGGHHMQPYLVNKVIAPDGKVVLQNEPKQLNGVDISQQTLDEIKQAMQGVVTRNIGTAYGVFNNIPNFTGGAKTGTAQLGSKGTAGANEYNGTFVAFTPYNNPQIAFAGVIEHAEWGSNSAGVVADAAFYQYYKEKGMLPKN